MLKELMNFLDESRSAFNAVDNFKAEFLKNGYVELKEHETYNIKKGGKYFVTRNSSSIIAFNIGKKLINPSLHIAASHTDCPSYKLKPNSLLVSSAGVKLNTEPYGGTLPHTWFDKPLGISGRVMIKKDGKIKEVIFDSKEMFCLIPAVAPHLSRGKDIEAKLNAQVDLLPLVGLDPKFTMESYLSKKLKTKKENVVTYDLYLYPLILAQLWGSDKELISSHHLDNLESAFISYKGFINNFNDNNINVFASFDNEEVGSLTRQGAESDFLFNNLKRICDALKVDLTQLSAKGFLLSIDNGHALHPNHPELSDPNNTPVMNGGVVIKVNARQSYTSDSLSCALFKNMCDENNIKYQVMANRSDCLGGSTLGNINNSKISLVAIDIGLAQLAMHSSYETAGAKDVEEMYKACDTFYKGHFDLDGKGNYSL